MSKNIFILLIKAVGRYLVIVFNINPHFKQIIKWIEQNYDSVKIDGSTLSFTMEVHENPAEVAQQIFKIYESTKI